MKEPIYIIGYARVSTTKQSNEGGGLEDQEKAIKAYAKMNGYTLYPDNIVFMESFSGSQNERPVFNQILKIIDANPKKIKYFVVKVIDRFSRGGVAGYEQMKKELQARGVALKDVAGVIQDSTNTLAHLGVEGYEWSNQSNSSISEVVMAEMARSERASILTRMIGAEIALTQDGYHIGSADDGYLAKRIYVDGKKKFVLEPHPDRAHFFVEMFKLRAEGVFSDKEIIEKLNAMGFKTLIRHKWDKEHSKIIGKTGGMPLTVKQLQRYMERVCYAGLICEKWTKYLPVKAKWKGLISYELFNKANRGKVFIKEYEDGKLELFYNQSPEKNILKRNKYRSDFCYKNVVMCSLCKKPLNASASKNKLKKSFDYYHCSRKHHYFGVPKDELDKNYLKCLSRIRFNEDFFNNFEKVLIAKHREQEGDLAVKTARANRNIAELEERKAQLIQSFPLATNKEVRDGIQEQVTRLQKEIEQSQEHRNGLEVSEKDVHDFIDFSRKLLEHPVKILDNVMNMQEQLALYGLFFDEYPTYEEIVNGTPKLSLVFKLNDENEGIETQLVTLRGVEPRFEP